jgi:hypothetical protein
MSQVVQVVRLARPLLFVRVGLDVLAAGQPVQRLGDVVVPALAHGGRLRLPSAWGP